MDLIGELKKRADFYNKYLKEYLKDGSPEILYDAARHLPYAGGKRLRPVISILACESLDGNPKKVLPVANGIELLHNFTLVHDDIMDKSSIRRNLPTVHIKFNESTAIIAGDLLYTKSFESIQNVDLDFNSYKKINNGIISCSREICEGQQMDMDFESKKIIAEEEYLEMIRKKTAVLFEYSAEAGAIVAGGSKTEIDALKNYGRYLGLGFQIQDDYLDMSSDVDTLGKDIGNDIRNGKKTIIAVHSLNNAKGEDKKILERVFGNHNATEDEIKNVYNLFKKLGSVKHAKKTALMYNDMAKHSLDVIKDSEVKEILLKMVDFSTYERNK